MINDFSGGLRGLRPPATFFATLRVARWGLNNRDVTKRRLDHAERIFPNR